MQGDAVPGSVPDDDGPPRGLMIAALAVSVGAVAAVLAVAATHRSPHSPVVIGAVPAPQADSGECRSLLGGLPDRLGDYRRAETARPTPAGTAAWRDGGEPVILRCGVDRPAEFIVGAPIQMVDRVQWFQLADPASGRSTWLCVDRPVYVALTLPDGSGSAPIQTLSEVIDRAMPAIGIRPGKP